MLNTPMDGFTLNPATRYWPGQFFPGALAQMEILRRANLYRPRWFVVPDDFNQPIPPYGTLEYQIKVGPASYLWGYRFVNLGPPPEREELAPADIYIQITDSCTGIGLFSEFVNGSASALYQTAPQRRGAQFPYLLPQPRLILEPGLVNVEMSSTSAEEVTCQLTLLFAEPCSIVDERGSRRSI
jgi:hypothetical protein